jgi:hypothetical protein
LLFSSRPAELRAFEDADLFALMLDWFAALHYGTYAAGKRKIQPIAKKGQE